MNPSDTASGDLLADRRADYAEMLFAQGDHAAATQLMLGALDLAPAWAMGWFRLGEFQEAAGKPAEAEQAWRMAQKLDPQDRAGAALKLQLIDAIAPQSSPPSAFVETLFDQYADRFDHALVDTLDYRVPALLMAAIARHGNRGFTHALDLGCGTGLMGERLRPIVDDLEGHDISAAMLARAKAKGIYDRLVKSDLQTLSLPAHSADLVTAADVFMYVGSLDRIVGEAARALRPGGLFAFSIENHDGPEDFALRETRRYAHSRAYIDRVLDTLELHVRSIVSETIRRDRNVPVEGLIVSTCKK